MNDRELLTLAAKAAGYELRWHEIERDEDSVPVDFYDSEWCYIPYEGNPTHNKRASDKDNGRIWNPLTSDGDALRLAVNLGFEYCCRIEIGPRQSSVQFDEFTAYETGDPYAATRRAIVRAAASLAGAGGGEK